MYNSLLQLTQLTTVTSCNVCVPATVMDVIYTYSGTQNNGRITQATETISGSQQTVNYMYDTRNRLIQAAAGGAQWGQAYTYDGFGNQTNKAPVANKDGVPVFSLAYDPATNRQVGASYDGNGNLLGASTWVYDVENRLVQEGERAVLDVRSVGGSG